MLPCQTTAVCGLNHKVESIRHAAVMVGLERLRIWASLILFSGMEDKPRDVIVTGAVRARMCEKLAESLKIHHPERTVFRPGRRLRPPAAGDRQRFAIRPKNR